MSNGPGDDAPEGADEVGSVSEEAAKLFGALSDWAREHGPDLGETANAPELSDLAGRAAAAVHEVSEHVDTGDLVRATSPEVRDHLATAAASLLQAAAGILAAAAAPAERAQPGVEHIDLDDEDWPEEET